jgi:hypothetical protein
VIPSFSRGEIPAQAVSVKKVALSSKPRMISHLGRSQSVPRALENKFFIYLLNIYWFLYGSENQQGSGIISVHNIK